MDEQLTPKPRKPRKFTYLVRLVNRFELWESRGKPTVEHSDCIIPARVRRYNPATNRWRRILSPVKLVKTTVNAVDGELLCATKHVDVVNLASAIGCSWRELVSADRSPIIIRLTKDRAHQVKRFLEGGT